MKIRNYSPGDKEEVVEMITDVLGSVFNGNPRSFKLLKEFSKKKFYILYLVAIIDGKIVGTMALKKVNGEIVRLKRMYVRKGYEGRGIAQKLLNEIVKFATANGYKKLVLHIYPIMSNANRFMRKNGFVEDKGDDPEQIHVVKNLE